MAIALPALIFVLWWIVSADSTSFFWPPLQTILGVFPETWFEGRFAVDVLPSLVRLLIGFAAAAAFGIALGLAVGTSKALRDYSEPVLEFMRAIPPPVLIPIIMLFAGIGDTMKIIVIAFGSFWPILLNTVEGVRSIDEVLRDTARTYRIGRGRRFVHLVLRGASPQIMVGARQGLSVAVILMVISEMFAASNGIGFTIVRFQRGFALPEMWTGIILLGSIGVALSIGLQVVERRTLRWYHGLRQSEKAR
jgi:ABC-type nitrate/sulfonate/bicarbonate transport system permease component